jgi:hypothetical protein
MTNDVLQFPNAMGGGISTAHNVAARATEWIRKWFRRADREQLNWELKLRLEEREWDGFAGACMQLHDTVEQMVPDSPGKPAPNGALQNSARRLMHPAGTSQTLEEALSSLRDELSRTGASFRVFVTGKSNALRPVMQEHLYLIGREALVNALRHSRATNIEAEIEYLPRRLRMVVRDNGCGIDPQAMRSGRNAHWGLVGMRERAGSIGANLRIWSRTGFGTEIELSVPRDTQ